MIRVGAVGIPLKVLIEEDGVAVDISGVNVKQILLRRAEDGVLVTKPATFVDDGVDGWMQYTTIAGDIGADRTDNDAAGDWGIQGHVEWSGGQKLDSEIEEFPVGKNLV